MTSPKLSALFAPVPAYFDIWKVVVTRRTSNNSSWHVEISLVTAPNDGYGFLSKPDRTVHPKAADPASYKISISPNPSLQFTALQISEMEAVRREEGWETPKQVECRIPTDLLCPPPPPRKRSPAIAKRREPPKGGYFQPPDLEVLFALAPSREVCVWGLISSDDGCRYGCGAL